MLEINHELHQGKYRITKLFGQGKTVSFYEAFDVFNEKKTLLKRMVFPPTELLALEHDRFAVEAKFFTEIDHDGFIRIPDFFSDQNAHYLAMEMVDGKNLGELCKNGDSSFAIGDVVSWGEQVLDALSYLHERTSKLTYFNLKPSNIHLTSDGQIKLLVTGIASRPDESGAITRHAFDTANINYSPLELIWEKLDAATKRVILNSCDESAEKNLSQSPDLTSDIYSAAATFYQLLTGKPPVDALERSIEILEGRKDPMVPIAELDPPFAREISEFLVKALQINRSDRFQTAAEMRVALSHSYNLLRERKAQEFRSEVPAEPNMVARHLRPVEPKFKKNPSPVPSPQADPFEFVNTNSFKSADVVESDDLLELVEAEDVNVVTAVVETKPLDPIKVIPDPAAEIIEEILVSETLPEPEDLETWPEEFIDDSDEVMMESTEWNFDAESEDCADAFQFSYDEPKKENKLLKRLAVAASAIIIFGGGVFGLMKLIPPTNDGQSQPSSSESVASQEVVSPTNTEGTSVDSSGNEISNFSSNPSEDTTDASEKPVLVNEKPMPTPQQIATAKTPEKPKTTADNKNNVTVDDLINDTPKKKVTVDDLISDN